MKKVNGMVHFNLISTEKEFTKIQELAKKENKTLIRFIIDTCISEKKCNCKNKSDDVIVIEKELKKAIRQIRKEQ